MAPATNFTAKRFASGAKLIPVSHGHQQQYPIAKISSPIHLQLLLGLPEGITFDGLERWKDAFFHEPPL